MTDEQRAYVEETREYLQRETMLRVGSHAREKRLLRIIDAQEAELQAARDTIARYEAMMREMEEVFLTGAKVNGTGIRGLRDCGESWSYFTDSGYTDDPEWKTPLDAYTALKEATG